MSIEIKSQLESKGWYLSDEGLAYIQENFESEQPSTEEIVKEALNTDLRQVSRGILPRDVSEKKEISGPLVLQLLSIINLSTPLQNQQATPRLFQLTFTDGAKKVKGIEIFGHVENVSLNTPPGTKFLVIKDISIHDNLLFLGPGMLEFLGGEVEEMIKEWKVGRQGEGAVKDDEGPPPFIPFKIKNSDYQTSQHSNNDQFNESVKFNNKDNNNQLNNKRGQNQNKHQNSRQRNQNNNSNRGNQNNNSNRGNQNNNSNRGNRYNSSNRGNQYNSSNRGNQYNSSNRGNQYNNSNRGRGRNRERGEEHFDNSHQETFASHGHHQVRGRNQSYNDDLSTNSGQYRGRGDQHHGNSPQQNMVANRGHYRGHYRGHGNEMYGWGRDEH
ncbi:19603_t:CDS:2 [Dentiscutata erythropus]|uniref:RecQ-mediated genome instability protein 1 n=1 Tax=Dentiscutata erythropus TaxID=1348616 RepID=A0A9N9D982_9GLOM|nr:19603_t:CDS:2 [Dentiscutata erythropus]